MLTINDDRVLMLLQEIENELGYGLGAYQFSSDEYPGHLAQAVIPVTKDDKYKIGVADNIGVIEQHLIAHELLHIKLRLERWPYFYPSAEQSRADTRAAARIRNFIDHFEIHDRLIKMGLLPGDRIQDALASLGNWLKNGATIRFGYEDMKEHYIWTEILEELSYPFRQSGLKNLLFRFALEGGEANFSYLREPIEKALRIRALFGDCPDVDSNNYCQKLRAALDVAGLPQECLILNPAEKQDYHNQ